MNNFISHKVIFLTIFLFFTVQSEAADRILPLAKPNISDEVKKKILFDNPKRLYGL